MNKITHVYVTRAHTEGMHGVKSFCFKLGCIMPDLLLYTYAKGHTYESRFDEVCDRIRKLSYTGELNAISCLKLGYILHYVEDFFTYPHNNTFQGTLSDHVAYEAQFSIWMKDSENQYDPAINEDISMAAKYSSCPDILILINKLHNEYLEKKPCFTNDSRYMHRAASMLTSYFMPVFARNRAMRKARLAFGEAEAVPLVYIMPREMLSGKQQIL